MREVPLLLGILLSLGCGSELDLPPIRYRTEHLSVGTDFPEPVCQGTLTGLDRHVTLLEELLDFELGEPIELYLYLRVPPACDGAEGCFHLKRAVVLTEYWAARHELGHAVAERWGSPVALFGEGFAEAFSGYRSSFFNRYEDQVSTPSHCLGIEVPAGSVDELGGHFLRWLYDESGAEPLKELIRLSDGTGADNARAAFRTAYGMEIENADQRYYAEAPDYYPGWSHCSSELDLVPWEGDRWQPVVELDCAAEHTRGVTEMQRTLGFDLPQAGQYVFEVEAPGAAFISTCETEIMPRGGTFPRRSTPVEQEPIGSEKAAEDGSKDSVLYRLGAGAPYRLDLAAGRYRVTVAVPGTEATAVRLSLTPHLGLVVAAPVD